MLADLPGTEERPSGRAARRQAARPPASFTAPSAEGDAGPETSPFADAPRVPRLLRKPVTGGEKAKPRTPNEVPRPAGRSPTPAERFPQAPRTDPAPARPHPGSGALGRGCKQAGAARPGASRGSGRNGDPFPPGAAPPQDEDEDGAEARGTPASQPPPPALPCPAHLARPPQLLPRVPGPAARGPRGPSYTRRRRARPAAPIGGRAGPRRAPPRRASRGGPGRGRGRGSAPGREASGRGEGGGSCQTKENRNLEKKWRGARGSRPSPVPVLPPGGCRWGRLGEAAAVPSAPGRPAAGRPGGSACLGTPCPLGGGRQAVPQAGCPPGEPLLRPPAAARCGFC